MKNIIFAILALYSITQSFADCTFNVTNYSDTPVFIEAGFYDGEKQTFKVDVASGSKVKVKNTLTCNSISPVGFGVTYMNLVTKLSSGGWVYSPTSKMIKAIGTSYGSQDAVVGVAPNGTKLILFNNMSPSTDSFDVRIEKAGRNISRQLGSMN